ncbi:MAG: hypothetical protein PHD05_02185 [Sphaerochaetaceae bacterium]|nr:hypothetical protein [Sphaerochaetaceae bacterium]
MGTPGRIFNGTSDYVQIPSSVTTDLSNFSVSFWVKTTESGANGTYWNRPSLFGNSTPSSPDSDFGIVTNGGYLCIWSGLYTGGDNSICSNYKINDNYWHMVSLTKDDDSLDLYLDGEDTGSTLSANQALNNYGYWIGAQHYYSGGAAFYHQGIIEDFAIWNKTLSSSEINELYRKGVSRLDLNVYSCSDSLCATKTGTQNISNAQNSVWVNLNSSVLNSRYLGIEAYFLKAKGFEDYNAENFWVGSYLKDFNILFYN